MAVQCLSDLGPGKDTGRIQERESVQDCVHDEQGIRHPQGKENAKKKP
jgi:hypothetical protein